MEDNLRVTQRIFRLFTTHKPSELQNRSNKSCCVCGALNIHDGVEMREESVDVLLEALLVEVKDKNGTKYSATWICGRCVGSLSSLVNLFNKLEAMRQEFNELRRHVGRKVILWSLGESEEEYTRWVGNVNSVEDVYPSSAIERLLRQTGNAEAVGNSLEVIEELVKSEDEEMFAEEPLEFSEYFVNHFEERKDDPKLNQMRATVVLKTLNTVGLESLPRVPDLNRRADKSTGDKEIKLEGWPEESDCNEGEDNYSQGMQGDAEVTDTRIVRIPEQLFRPTSVPMRMLETTDDEEADKCIAFCWNDNGSILSSGAVAEGETAGTLGKGEDSFLRKVILCEYCDLTFPTKLSWIEHRRRIHPDDSTDHEYLSDRGVNNLEGLFVNGRKLPYDIRGQIVELTNRGVGPYAISRQLKVSTGFISTVLSWYKGTESTTENLKEDQNVNVTKQSIVDAIENYTREGLTLSADLIIDRLLSDGIFSQNNIPSRSTITRIMGNYPARNIIGQISKDHEGSECNKEQSPPTQETHGNCEVFGEGNEINTGFPLKNKTQLRKLPSRHLDISGFEDVDVNDEFCGVDSATSRKENPCDYCDMTIPTKLEMMEHQKHIHSLDSANPKTPKCRYCLRLFLKTKSLDLHLIGVHYGISSSAKRQEEELMDTTPENHSEVGPRKIYCSICDKMQRNCFSRVQELEAHAVTEIHLEKLKLQLNVHCNVCRLGFGGETKALQDHLKTKAHFKEMETLGLFKSETFCLACRVDCVTRKDLNRHRSSNGHWTMCNTFMGSRVPVNYRHKLNLKCPFCPKKLTNGHGLRVHLKRCHKQGGNVCEFCGKAFFLLRDYYSHRRIHKVPKMFSCSECSLKYTTEKELSIHKYKCHTRDRFMCPTCGKTFKTKAGLDKHEQTKHETGDESIWKYSCTFCSKRYYVVVQLRRHMYKGHKDEILKDTPHVCLVCFHGFKTPDELAVHMAAHDDLKCYFCGKYFGIISNLENHLRVHI